MTSQVEICRELGIDPPLASYYQKTGLIARFTPELAGEWRNELRLVIAGRKAGLSVQEIRRAIADRGDIQGGAEMSRHYISALEVGLGKQATPTQIVDRIRALADENRRLRVELGRIGDDEVGDVERTLTERVRTLMAAEPGLEEHKAVARVYDEDPALHERVVHARRYKGQIGRYNR